MELNHLHIRRLTAEYLVSAEHPEPERVRQRLDRALGRRLATQLEAAFSGWFPETDTSVWLIKQLDFEVAVNAAWEGDQLARAMTMEIARTLGALLDAGADSDNVVRFPDRAAFLARFLSDAASGLAWGRWYYKSFAGLKLLSVSSALRTAICDRTETGKSALLGLGGDELQRVLSALTPADAGLILEAFAEAAVACDPFDCFRAAWATWAAWPNASRQARDDDDRKLALELFLGASRDREDLGGSELKTATLALSALHRRIATASEETRRRLLEALITSSEAPLRSTVGEADARLLAPLRSCPPDWVAEVARVMSDKEGTAEASGWTATQRDTAFGGAFLLMPLLDELPLANATREWPDLDGVAASSIVRFLILLKCCGNRTAYAAFRDPLLRDLLLIPPSISPISLKEWRSHLKPAHLRSFLDELRDWQISRGAVRGDCLVLARSCAGKREAAVLIDGTRGLWLMLERLHRPGRLIDGRLIEALRGPLSRLDRGDCVLRADEAWLGALASAFPSLKGSGYETESTASAAEGNDLGNSIIARLGKLADELEYLSLPGLPGVLAPARGLDFALSVAAQNVMRNFAWRLPGFATSNLPYLSRNFLAISGSVEDEPDEPHRRVVRLTRPPLQLVLSMTGMARQTYRLSWLDDRPFALFQEA